MHDKSDNENFILYISSRLECDGDIEVDDYFQSKNKFGYHSRNNVFLEVKPLD